ncbi:MAG: hypothetical protein N4A74_01775 [Carboxylicivirga sp.]|jgi:hypothetical protein|nr:hypothetical protein [Carboxylicivirga sp.]
MNKNSMKSAVEKKFYKIYKSTTEKAENDFKEFFINKIKSKSLIEQFIFILNKQKWLADKVGTLNPFYTDDYKYPDLLLKIFADRSFILRIDESETLSECIYFSYLKSNVTDLLKKIKDQIPPYTSQDFFDGKHDSYFFDYDYFYHLNKKDYYSIRHWQINQLIEIVSCETKILINNIQKELEGVISPKEYLTQLKLYYSSKIEGQVFENHEELIIELQELPFLKGSHLRKVINQSTLNYFNKVSENQIYWGGITPKKTKNIKVQMQNNPTSAFTPAYTLCFSIIKVMSWVDETLRSGNFFDVIELPDLESIYSNTCQIARQTSKVEINKLSEGYLELSISDKKQHLYNTLESLRQNFNKEQLFQDYYQFIHDEPALKHFFIINIFLSSNAFAHIEYITKALVYRQSLEYFWSERSKLIGDNNLKAENKGTTEFLEAMQMVKTMPFDLNLYRKIRIITDQALSDFEVNRLPIGLITRSMEESMRDIFFESIENLTSHLNQCPIPNQHAYISTKLYDLRLRQIRLKKYENQLKINNDDSYAKIFQDFLIIQKEYINDAKNVNFIAIFNRISSEQVKQLPNKQSFTFGLKPSPKSLLNLIKVLTVHVNFLNTDLTSPQDLYDLLSAENTFDLDIEIHFGCYTNQVAYIIDKLKPYFKNLNPTTIESSGLFFSRGGTQITAQNLYSNKLHNASIKAKINNIFNDC